MEVGHGVFVAQQVDVVQGLAIIRLGVVVGGRGHLARGRMEAYGLLGVR